MDSRHRPGAVLALVTASALVLSACGSGEAELVRDPYPVDGALPTVDVSDARLPLSLEGLAVVDPGWDTEPQHADGVYLAAGERDEHLEFTAVDVHGEVLWAARRPATCTGFALTTDDQGRALAVLTDAETTRDALAATTATAYELSTGTHVWGPVEIPGPHHGPGLVFAAPSEEAMGDTGPRVALDPGTGRVAATGGSEERVLGEFHGTLLVVADGTLIARAAGDARERWHITVSDHGWDASAIHADPRPSHAPGMVLLATSDSTGALLDLHDGTVVSPTARAVGLDPATGTLITLDDTALQAHDADQPLWQHPAAPTTSIAAAGGALLYLRQDEAVRAYNVITGAVAEAYDPGGHGRILVPAHFTSGGAALLLDGGRHLVATIPRAPGSDGPAGLDR